MTESSYEKKIAAFRYGQSSEEKVFRYLEKLGWQILEKNFRTKFAEIDCIALDQDALVFVEVRARHSEFSLETINARKLQKLRLGAQIFLAHEERPYWQKTRSRIKWENIREIRFDCIAVQAGSLTKHIRGAFFL